MDLSAEQIQAFKVNGGFEPSQLGILIVAAVFAVLLVWGVWAIKTAYAGWVSEQLSHKEFSLVVVRFFALYIVLSFVLLS